MELEMGPSILYLYGPMKLYTVGGRPLIYYCGMDGPPI